MNLSVAARNLTTGVPRYSQDMIIVRNVMMVVICISITYINGILVHTFRQHQVLNTNPRYILYIHLVVNDIILLALIALLHVLTYTFFKLHFSLCLLLVVVAILANLNSPLTLAIMVLECYVAICLPLRYMQICTVKKTYLMIGLVWVTSSLTILPDVFIVLTTESMDFLDSRIHCLRDIIFQSPWLTEKRDVSFMVLLVLTWLTLVFAYFKLLFVAQAMTNNARKAKNTILLHGFQLSLCMLTYTYNHITYGLIALFPQDSIVIRYISVILLQVLPRLINPLVYGLRDKTFRKYVRKSLCRAERDDFTQRENQKRPDMPPCDHSG